MSDYNSDVFEGTAKSEWHRLDGLRSGLLRRWEKYSKFTLPRICTPGNWDEFYNELAFDWQSVGAQAVNHVVNKLMLTLFAPSRPFMRLEMAAEERMKSSAAQILENEQALASLEKMATRELDTIPGCRAALYQILATLVVVGNCLIQFPKRSKNQPPQVYSPRQYVLRRTAHGDIKSLIVQKVQLFDELAQEVQDSLLESKYPAREYKAGTKIEHYIRIELQEDGKYELTQWIDDIQLSEDFNASYSKEKLPFKVAVWNLKTGDNYGTGLVEDYASDFAALSTMSEAMITGAILSAQFRWMVNPAGMTDIDMLNNSRNGSALPGQEGDITLLANSKSGDLQVVGSMVEVVIQRIGRGFLLGSAVTRNAERVTAEEIRMQAQELETALGGAYSRIAVDLQIPCGEWLLDTLKLTLPKEIRMSIVTGLDALSRGGDLAALDDFLNRVQVYGQLLPGLAARVDDKAVLLALAIGTGVEPSKYCLSEGVYAQKMKMAQQQMQQQEVQTAAIKQGMENSSPKNQPTQRTA